MAASMGMGREMIDWTKPIETVDGRKARVIKTLRLELWLLVWVAAEYEGPGDVYMMNAEGCRCDSRSIEMGLQTSQFIRNVRVKREGWVLKRKGLNLLGDYRVFETEKNASDASSFSEEVIRIEWEEEP
jgi:hypothetical protein